MSLPAFRFHHGGVSVPDLDAAIRWYGDVLGFTVEKRFDIPPAKARAAMVRNGASRMEIFEVADAQPMSPDRSVPNLDIRTHGNKHVAFEIDDMDSFMAAVQARGAEVVFVVREAFGSGFFIKDCAGNLIEFVTQP